MAGTYIPWDPVGDYGCGDPSGCPLCTPFVELEREAKHRKRVAATYPKWTSVEQLSAWFGEVYGTAGERGKPPADKSPITREERAVALATRNRASEKARVIRSLPPEDRDAATAHLKVCPVRKCYLRRSATGKLTRKEWLTEVWLELLNPSALTASREKSMVLEQKIERAASRAQHTMDRELTTHDRALAAAGSEGALS